MTKKSHKVFTISQTAAVAVVCMFILLINGVLTVFLQRVYNQQDFEEDAQALYQNVSHIVGTSEGVISTLTGVHQTNEQLERSELAAITQQLFETYPFISQIVKFQIVYLEERDEFEVSMASQGYYNFHIRAMNGASGAFIPQEIADQYAPVTHVEPNDPLAARIVGVDLFAQNEFVETLDEAIETNSAALMIRPGYLGGDFTLSVVRPTYFGHYVPGNVADRISQLEGGFIAITNMQTVIEPLVKVMGFSAMDIRLGTPAKQGVINTLVYQFAPQSATQYPQLTLFAPFKWQTMLPVGERFLTVSIERGFRLSSLQLVILWLVIGVTLSLQWVLIRAWFTWRTSEIESSIAKETVYRERERAEVTLQSIGDAVITTDHNDRIVYLNPIAEKMTGSALSDVRDNLLNDVVVLYSEEQGGTVCMAGRMGDMETTNQTDYLLQGSDDTSTAVKVSLSPLHNSQSEIIGKVIVLHDMSTVRELTNQLSYQATHDPLTGIANRRFFEEKLTQLINLSAQNGSVHALCYIDLDQFKLVNDTCGHTAGDELLIQLTGLFKQQIRENDTLARLGGDEFGLLLESCDISLADDLAHRIRSALHAFSFNYKDKVFNVRASIGVVEISRQSGELANVLSAADIACYSAKDAGRDEVRIYNPSDKDTISRQGEMRWLPFVQSALANDDFVLFLQPIVALRGRSESTRYEVLLRMVSETGELILPGKFIPAAERYGLMKEIDHWVIEHTIKRLGTHLGSDANASPQVQFSINLSGQSITDLKIIDHINQALERYAVNPALVCFEITETAAITNLSVAVELINTLKATSCCFSLDDFGTGLSSFAYLKRLPIDYLKIDGQFVKGIVDSQFDQAMIKSMCEIAKVFNIKIIAELVDNLEVAKKLEAVGVDFAQGYYYGYPSPADEVLQLIETAGSPHSKSAGH